MNKSASCEAKESAWKRCGKTILRTRGKKRCNLPVGLQVISKIKGAKWERGKPHSCKDRCANPTSVTALPTNHRGIASHETSGHISSCICGRTFQSDYSTLNCPRRYIHSDILLPCLQYGTTILLTPYAEPTSAHADPPSATRGPCHSPSDTTCLNTDSFVR